MAPKVVELPDCAFRRDRRAPRSSKEAPAREPRKKAAKPNAVMMLRDAKKDVFELGVSGLGKRAKRAIESERSMAFGAREKNQKMPFKMLLGIRRAEAKREGKEARDRLEAGVVGVAEKRDAVLGGAKKKRDRKQRDDIPTDNIRDGVLRVKRDRSTGRPAAPSGKKQRRR